MSERGRPPIIGSPEEFDRLVNEYVAECRNAIPPRPLTFAGLAFHLGFASRQSFYDYGKREAFSYSASRARLLIESGYEERLFGPAASGAQFALKNHGWSDRQQMEHSGPGGGPIRSEVNEMTDEELVRRARQLTNRLSVAGNGNGSHG